MALRPLEESETEKPFSKPKDFEILYMYTAYDNMIQTFSGPACMEGPFSVAEIAMLSFEGGMGGFKIFFWGVGSTTACGSSSSGELDCIFSVTSLVLDGGIGGVWAFLVGSMVSVLT